MSRTLLTRGIRSAAAVAVVCLCATPIVWGQVAQTQPGANAQTRSQPPQQPLQPSQVFRYPAAVAGSRLLTSVYGPTRPTYVTQRLTHVPDMFGDVFLHGQTLQVTELLDPAGSLTATLDLPAGGGTHLLVAENNKALPTDRVYFNYNHHHNALLASVTQVSAGGTFDLNRRYSVDRYTFGMEKTFFDGVWSAEVRVPLVGENNFRFAPEPVPADGVTAVDSSVFGNVSLIVKTLLYASDNVALSTGLGIETPTGDAAQARVGSFLYTIENDAFHLHPFLAVMGDSDNDVFYHGFLQLDVPTNGNDFRSTNVSALNPGGSGELGRLDDQFLLHLNVGTGYWFFRSSQRACLTGLAGLLELHCTTTLENTDTVTFGPMPPVAVFDRSVVLSNRRINYCLLNLTTGLHLELDPDTLLRLAVAVPLLPDDNRFFDAEPMLQLTRRF